MVKEAILLVDDEAIMTLDLKSQLQRRFKDKYIYATAINAEDGLKILSQLILDKMKVILIISDWSMPGMNGKEFLAEVEKRHPGIHAVLISAYPGAWVESNSSEVGTIRACFSKPINFSALARFIESLHLDQPPEQICHD
jgi:DNA-binding NtrC family response regulator